MKYIVTSINIFTNKSDNVIRLRKTIEMMEVKTKRLLFSTIQYLHIETLLLFFSDVFLACGDDGHSHL